MATSNWNLLTKEEQTAGLVPALKAKYWGCVDMVNGTFLAENGTPALSEHRIAP